MAILEIPIPTLEDTTDELVSRNDVPVGLHVVPTPEELVERWGRSSVSPHLLATDREVLCLEGSGVAGYARVGRWAVLPTGPAAPPGLEDLALDDLLSRLAADGLKPVFAAVSDPSPYTNRGMVAIEIAHDTRIALADFSLAGKRRANIRHSVSSAHRAGLRMVPWSVDIAAGVAEVSAAWLSTKRGGEMGFTLGRFSTDTLDASTCRVALDAAGRVVGFVTWRSFDDGRGRVLDLMRRVPDAPNPTIDFLIAESLLEFAEAGVEVASLAAVPVARGRLAEHVYPTATLRKYKEKFAPTWEPLYLIAPSRPRLLGALRAIASAYCPGGLRRAIRRNH
jgi:phosphatidylglycerol lysyltransferase